MFLNYLTCFCMAYLIGAVVAEIADEISEVWIFVNLLVVIVFIGCLGALLLRASQ